MNNLISIIIPVYNAEKYIERCINSVQEQTYTNIEIIIVDDGSSDNSVDICKQKRDIDNRIKILCKKNGGASSARNAGLDISKGDYIVFVDSDDYVCKNYIENLWLAIINNYDIVQCGTKKTNDGLENRENIEFNKKDLYEITKIDALNGRKYKVSLWGKIYKSSLFNNFRFKEGIIYEDDASYYILVDKSERIAILNEVLYYYFLSDNSVMRNSKVNKSIDFIQIYKDRIDYFIEKENMPLLYGTYDRYCLVLMLTFAASHNNNTNIDDMPLFLKEFKRYYRSVIKTKEVKVINKIMYAFFYVSPKTASKIIGLLRR